jgi:hypothetical protein
VVNVPWLTEQLVLNTLSCKGFETWYVNLKPSPDIIATRYVDLLKKIKEVWLVEVKGINESLVRVDQLEVLVNLAASYPIHPMSRPTPWLQLSAKEL